jgi:hypothetical protein
VGNEVARPKFKKGDVCRVYADVVVDGKPEPVLPIAQITITGEPKHDLQGKFYYPTTGGEAVEDMLARAYTHISPTGLLTFEKSKDEFYMRYMARNKPPKLLQTQPMSIGSSFDANVKSYLQRCLCQSKGKPVPEEYLFEKLFLSQVEPHNREWALGAGLYAFGCYKQSGALADILLEISQGDKDPRFEFEMRGTVALNDGVVPITGKPDLYFHNKLDARVVLDWKVNGFCSNSGQSPKPHHIISRDGWEGNQTKNHRKAHKDAQVFMVKGIQVNVARNMEDIDKDWALQLCTYAWLMGEPVGGDFISGLEQLVCAPSGIADKPQIRVASFRNKISQKFQFEVFERYQKCWSCISSGHFFPELSLEDSRIRCQQLERVSVNLQPTGDSKLDWFSNQARVR